MKTTNDRRVLIIVTSLAALLLGLSWHKAHGAEPNFNPFADAVRRSEGVWWYGVNVTVKTEAEARQVCLNTLRHAWADWNGQGNFINFAADRYCPPQCDRKGNLNWKRNVRLMLPKAYRRQLTKGVL